MRHNILIDMTVASGRDITERAKRAALTRTENFGAECVRINFFPALLKFTELLRGTSHLGAEMFVNVYFIFMGEERVREYEREVMGMIVRKEGVSGTR